MDNPFKSPAVISFCPGILGIERGLKRAGINPRVMAYVEIEAYIIANLVAGMEAGILDSTPIWTDAKTFNARPFRRRIHAITGGYPCTPFSLAGTRSGEDHPGHIYPAISRAFEATRPFWGFFENVDDHLSLGFDKVYQDLQRMGYRVETGIYTAEEVGAPHERERLFILAVANSYGDGYGTGAGQTVGAGSKNESSKQRKEWDDLLRQWMWDVVRNSGQKVGNTISRFDRGIREELFTKETKLQQSKKEEIGLFSRSRVGCSSFPMGQGYEQHPWEAPRTIESSLGCTIDGYNFRNDLLRALGNSVVEQTAELAFIELIKKHLNHLQK